MKFVQIEYPDGTLHNVLVNAYNHSEDKDVDYIEYFDITERKDMYTLLKVEDDKIYKDSSNIDYTFDELSKNITNKNLKELPNVIKNYKVKEKDNSKYEFEFEVYETESGLYIASNIAQAFHLNKKYRNKKINNIICVPVNEEEVKRIELISNQGIPSLKAKKVNIYQNQAEFMVFHVTETNKYFVNERVCTKYSVGTGTHYINGELCREVSYEDIQKIENKSKYDNPSLKAHFKDLGFDKEKIEAYINNYTNKHYIKENICNRFNIGEGHHYINDVLYKEVSTEEIEKLQNNNEEIVYKTLKLKYKQKFLVYVDESNNRLFIELETSKLLGIGRGNHFIGTKPCREVTQKEIDMVVERSKETDVELEPEYIHLVFENTNVKYTKNEDKTEVYKDKNNNNKLYLKKEDCNKLNIGDLHSFKYINNNECYEISLIELTKIKNPIVKTVHLQKEVEFKFTKENNIPLIVCTYKGLNFIDKNIALKYNIEPTEEIRVDGIEFTYINEENIEKIENNSNLVRKIVNIEPRNNLNEMIEDDMKNRLEETNENKIK